MPVAARKLRRQIRGQWSPGDRFKTSRKLARYAGIQRAWVRQQEIFNLIAGQPQDAFAEVYAALQL